MEEKQKKKLDLSQQNKRSGTNGVRYILHKFRCVCMIVVFESHYFLLFDVFFVFFSELEYFAHNKFSCNVFTFNSDLTCIQKDCWLISFFLLSCQKQLIWFNTAEIKLFISNVRKRYRKIYCRQNIQDQKKTQKIHQITKNNDFQKQQSCKHIEIYAKCNNYITNQLP
jgi:hypothetical protein